MHIYVVSHKEFRMPVRSSIYKELYVGKNRYELSGGTKMNDSMGLNISEKNPMYNEITALYWIWKNSKDDIVGLCHYRRYFVTVGGKLKNIMFGNKEGFIGSVFIKNSLKKYDMIVHNKTFFRCSNIAQMTKNRNLSVEKNQGKLEKEIVSLTRKVFVKLYPEHINSFDRVMNKKSAHLLNMFVARKSIVDEYCEWLFPILEYIEKILVEKKSDEDHLRVIGMIAERLLDVWIDVKNLRIKECFSINTERIDWKMW